MTRKLKGWLVPLLLLGTLGYAIAEEITLTTYYPSPRGVYQELRTQGNVQIGSVDAPAVAADAPRLYVVQDTSVTSIAPALRVDARDPLGTISPLMVIDKDGNVGIGAAPTSGTKLDVNGTVRGSMRLEAVGSKPACDASHQFLLWPVPGDSGINDRLDVCVKTSLDTYIWRPAVMKLPIWKNLGTRDNVAMWHANCASGSSATFTCDETAAGQEVFINPGLGVGSGGFEWRTELIPTASATTSRQGSAATILESGAKLQVSGYVGCSLDEKRLVTATVYSCGYQ